MSSQEEVVNVVATSRVGNKLTLDSEEEERRQEQERQIIEQKNRRKQQKRKKRQEAQRLERQRLQKEKQKERKYDQPEMMFEEDSDDGIQFRRVVKKIKRTYPQFTNKHQIVSNKKKDNFIVDDDEDEDEQSESGSYDDDEQQSSSEEKNHKKQERKKKIEKKERRPQKRVQKKIIQKKKVQVVKKEKIKIQPKSSNKKEHLVKQVSIRWWYALPQWPPADFNYEEKLKDMGYRVLTAQQFKLQDDIVNGLQKVIAVQGYKGVYKSKTKLIDVRPKESAPTLRNFRNMSIEQLTSILKKALAVQIQHLKKVQHKQLGEDELLTNLQRQLLKLK